MYLLDFNRKEENVHNIYSMAPKYHLITESGHGDILIHTPKLAKCTCTLMNDAQNLNENYEEKYENIRVPGTGNQNTE